MLIQALVTPSKSRELKLARMIKRIILLASSFHKIEFFHILKTLNVEADRKSNKAITLGHGEMLVNNEVQRAHLP